MIIDYVVVGSGFSGIVVAERISNDLKKEVLLIEKRNHIGGNCYDYYNDDGILIQKYGPHIFHTNYKEVWNYLSQFTEWNSYKHKVLAVIDDKKIPLPFNLNSIYMLFDIDKAKKLEIKLTNNYGLSTKVPILNLRKSNDKDIRLLAEFIYEKVFLNYNIKQWGMRPEQLDTSVTERIPVVISKDNNYFQDEYQGIPKNGYTKIFKRMLASKNIRILLNTDYKKVINSIKYKMLIYTGPIDYFFDYKHGKLPYRSMQFKFETKKKEIYQESAVINYPNDNKFIRITEYKHLTGQKHFYTTISKEFPINYYRERNVPCYPIPTKKNLYLYKKYKADSLRLSDVIFLGRLAEYKYYNMDEVINKALIIFKEKIYQNEF
ncbi:MAG: UDP-galactopyranose mutase [Candidatus Helarchaeota archaeon]